MGLPSTKERVGNMDKIKSRNEVIKSNVDTRDEKVGRNKSYADILIHRNIKWHNIST